MSAATARRPRAPAPDRRLTTTTASVDHLLPPSSTFFLILRSRPRACTAVPGRQRAAATRRSCGSSSRRAPIQPRGATSGSNPSRACPRSRRRVAARSFRSRRFLARARATRHHRPSRRCDALSPPRYSRRYGPFATVETSLRRQRLDAARAEVAFHRDARVSPGHPNERGPARFSARSRTARAEAEREDRKSTHAIRMVSPRTNERGPLAPSRRARRGRAR